MLNVLKLKAARVEADISIEEIARVTGRNPTTIYRKFDGKSEFTASELDAVKQLLGLSMDEFCDIFFSPRLAETQEPKESEVQS